MDHGEKHQGRDGSLDQLEKDIAEDLELGSQLRGQEAEGNPQHHGGDNLKRQILVEGFLVEGGHVCDLVVVIGEWRAEGARSWRAP
ncbi:hypothetical protein D3C87_1557510 [compost metagenome]